MSEPQAAEEEYQQEGEEYEEMDDGEAGEGMEDGVENELEAMRRKLAEMEEEAQRLKEQQQSAAAAGGGDAAAAAAPGSAAAAPAAAAPPTDAEAAAKEEADARSVYVGNVDYATTPEELQLHFQGCGTVNRVTILTDPFGNPKGFAYVEFLETDAVENALLQDASEIRGRAIKVLRKRTNVPGLKIRGRGRGRGRGGFHPGGGRGAFAPRGRGGFRGRGRGRGYAPY